MPEMRIGTCSDIAEGQPLLRRSRGNFGDREDGYGVAASDRSPVLRGVQ